MAKQDGLAVASSTAKKNGGTTRETRKMTIEESRGRARQG